MPAEIFRVRPEKTLGMSTAQWFSVVAIMLGLFMLATLRENHKPAA